MEGAGMRVTAIALTTLLAAGCHTYRPLVGVTPPEGTRVRLQLSDSGTTSLSSYLGPDVVEINGRILTADSDALTLSVSHIRTRDGSEPFWKGESVTIQRSLIARTEEERLSKSRTAGVAGASLALVVSIARGFGLSGTNDGSRGGGGGPGPR